MFKLFAITNNETGKETFVRALNTNDAYAHAGRQHFGVSEITAEEAIEIGQRRQPIEDTEAVTRQKNGTSRKRGGSSPASE